MNTAHPAKAAGQRRAAAAGLPDRFREGFSPRRSQPERLMHHIKYALFRLIIRNLEQ